jgi:hypothetical protein
MNPACATAKQDKYNTKARGDAMHEHRKQKIPQTGNGSTEKEDLIRTELIKIRRV